MRPDGKGRAGRAAFLAGGPALRCHALRTRGTTRVPEQRREAFLGGAVPAPNGAYYSGRGERGGDEREVVRRDHLMSLTGLAVGGNPPSGDNSSPPMGGSRSTVRN